MVRLEFVLGNESFSYISKLNMIFRGMVNFRAGLGKIFMLFLRL